MEKVNISIPAIAAVDRLNNALVVAFEDGKELFVPASALYLLAEVQELGREIVLKTTFDPNV